MSLPDDVLDHILSFLQFDFRALKACSQSDPRFIPLVKRHLYANITLHDYDFVAISEPTHGVRTAEFIDLLSRNPHIANYIRSLEFSIAFNLTGFILENVISILRMCSLVKTVTFRYTGSIYIALAWVSLPENFRLAFLDCLHLPSVKAVSIIDVSGFPLTALSSSNSVKSLTIVGCPPGPKFVPLETLCYPLLEHLTIQRCSQEALQKIITWVQPYNLRSLEVMLLESHDTTQLSRFFSGCSNTLTSLSLDIRREFQSSYLFGARHVNTVNHPATTLFLSLSSLLCLERLVIRADLDFLNHNGLPGINEFRSSIPSMARVLKTALPVQHLTLDFHFHLNSHLYIPYDSESLWSPLVSLISESASPYTNLRVMASGFLGRDAMTDHILSSFSQCTNLTQMVEQGVLVIMIKPVALKPLHISSSEERP